jgi:hypothetical protein
LNGNKTELLLFGTAGSFKKIPLHGIDVMQAGPSVIKSADVVRYLGVMLDAQLTMCDHISRTALACFFLRQLRSVRHSLGRDVTIQLVVALVFSRLDYCNAVLAGLPVTTLAPLQRVLHATARLVNGLRPRDHIRRHSRSSIGCRLLSSTNRVQTVPACPQVDRRSSASVYEKPPDCRR